MMVRKINCKQLGPSVEELDIAFVSPAYNEESNILPLYEACINAVTSLEAINKKIKLTWKLIIIDNCSQDKTSKIITDLASKDKRVIGYRNMMNYGPDANGIYGLKKITDEDAVIFLNADLQDPPSFGIYMLEELIKDRENHDAVIARKISSTEERLVKRIGRYFYYKIMNFSNRDNSVVPDFHGFGCYSNESIKQAIYLWDNTNMNIRCCLASSCVSPKIMSYRAAERLYGKSNYSLASYFNEATSSIITSRSIASKLSLRIGLIGLIISFIILSLILLNQLSGNSGYAPGIATVALITVFTSAINMILLSLVSRQVESQNTGVRRRMSSRKLK